MQPLGTRIAGLKTTFAGIAVLAACACGTSSQLGKLTGSYGRPLTEHQIHPLFVAVGSVLLLGGLWRRASKAALIGLAAVAGLAIGEKLLPTMGITEGSQLTAAQMGGVAFYLAAGGMLVWALVRAFPFQQSTWGVAGYTGLAASVGCNCCLVTQGIAGFVHVLNPAQHWHANSLAIYSIATAVMVVAVFRIAGALPALMIVGGHAIDYFGLELPYSAAPSITLHGLKLGFVSKYPLMLLGTAIMVGGFALAYALQKGRAGEGAHALPEPALAGD
jgi:hypothetical protein